MSHITRRSFVVGTAAVVGSTALAPITPLLPTPPAAADAFAPLAEAIAEDILKEIRGASVIRRITFHDLSVVR